MAPHSEGSMARLALSVACLARDRGEADENGVVLRGPRPRRGGAVGGARVQPSEVAGRGAGDCACCRATNGGGYESHRRRSLSWSGRHRSPVQSDLSGHGRRRATRVCAAVVSPGARDAARRRRGGLPHRSGGHRSGPALRGHRHRAGVGPGDGHERGLTKAEDFVASGVVVMRTPLLPAETLDTWAIAHDRALLRERLQAFISQADVSDALFLASPDLVESIGVWQREPDSKKGQRTEQGLVRYFLRMVTRPTPFGLFSGCTPGRVGERTELALAERGRYRRHSRLDMDYLHALSEHLARDPEIQSQLTFRPNPTLHEAAGRLRFAESRIAGRLRTYPLVAFDAFDALRDTLRRAANGARLRELAEALVASDPDGEITIDDAEAFIDDVAGNQLLLPDLAAP